MSNRCMPYYTYRSGEKNEADTERQYAPYHIRRGHTQPYRTIKFLANGLLVRCGKFMKIVGDIENVCTFVA